MERGYKFVEGSDKPFVCLKCKRGFTSEGGFKLHGPCGPAYGKGKGQGKANNGGGCTACGGGLRFLKANDARESVAVNRGYTMVCVKCEEVC